MAETQALGKCLGELLQPGDVVALAGELGAGKTAFTQGVARGLGIGALVTSPTFTLINQYALPGGGHLQHVDCYRLTDASAEMLDAGLTDLLGGEDIVIIEWADRIPELLLDEHLEIRFSYVNDEHRRFCFMAHGARYEEFIPRLLRCCSPLTLLPG